MSLIAPTPRHPGPETRCRPCLHLRTTFLRVLPGLILALFSLSPATAQLVSDRFTRLVMSENFDTINPKWTTLANAENLFIVQEGEYIVSRKTTISPFAILSSEDNPLQNFRIVASMNLERAAGDNGSLGLIFMAQPGGKGGLIAEVNPAGEYRLRQIAGGAYKNLTGTTRSDGWVSSKAVKPAGAFNLIDVRTSGGQYDLYANNNLLFSFSETAYKSGRIGLVVGPGTKGRIDFIYLFATGAGGDAGAAGGETPSGGAAGETGPSVIELAESIITLKTQINKLTEENQDLRKTIEAMQSDDDETAVEKKKYESKIRQLEKEMARSTASFDSITAVNASLQKYKELVAGNENSDLIITLSKSLKAEKERNEELEAENERLTELLKKKPPERDSKSTGQKTPSGNSQNSFSLPK